MTIDLAKKTRIVIDDNTQIVTVYQLQTDDFRQNYYQVLYTIDPNGAVDSQSSTILEFIDFIQKAQPPAQASLA